MRKLIFILIVFLTSGICFAQDIKPTSNLVTLPTYSFSYHTSDSTVWMYKGSTYQWTKLFRTWYVKSAGNVIAPIHSSDTLNLSVYKMVADSILSEGYATNWRLQHKIDSLYALTYRPVYQIDVTTNGVSTYTVPFTLRSNSMVFFNGSLIFNSLWWGVGTTTLTVGYDTHINDKINIQN